MNINQIFQVESGRIGPDIHQKMLNTTPWLKLINKDKWPEEMGVTIATTTYERSLPTTTVAWNNVNFNDGGGNNCVPSAHQIEIASTLRTYNLQQTALEGPQVCVNDLRYTWQRRKQLAKMFDVLAQNTGYLTQERARDEYVRLSEYKVVVRAGLPYDSSAFPAQAATSRLTQGVLDWFYMQQIRDGAGMEAVARVDGRPQFMILMSSEAQDGIFQDLGGAEKDVAGIRTDLRELGGAKELLGPLGVNHSYKGWLHMIDDFPPRHNFTGGAWVRVDPYVAVSTTKGNKYVVNSAYVAAEYEDSIIFHPKNYTCLIPNPITSPGGNTQFNPVNYMGKWSWKNILDRVENPDGNWGYFRGVFMNGSEPIHPEWGIVLRHKRCDFSYQLIDCSSL